MTTLTSTTVRPRLRRAAIAVATAVAALVAFAPAAQADWSNLGYTSWANGQTYFLGCKTAESGGYGLVYKTTIVGVNQTSTGKTLKMQVYRPGSGRVSSGAIWVPANSYRPVTLYASAILNDSVNASLYSTKAAAATGPLNPGYFSNC